MRQTLQDSRLENPEIRGLKSPALAGAARGGGFTLFRFDFAAGANAAQNIVMASKMRVVDAFLILRGAGVASEVVTVGKGASAISNGMAASGVDTTLVRAGTIDDANWDLASGDQLRVTPSAGASQPTMTVYVLAHAND